MNSRFVTIGIALLLGFGFCIGPAQAEEKKEETKKVEKGKEGKVQVSTAFLQRWKTIQKVTGKKAYETQQTRTVAGVRGAEAEDAVLDQLYYKGGVRYPSRVDLKNAITQLQDAVKADPSADTVPEQKYFIAQCHAQLGEADQASAVYKDLVKNHPDSDWAKEAKAALGKLSTE